MNAQQPGAAPVGQKDDYGDKAAGLINKHTGNHIKDKNTMEKITDGLRKVIEKVTGKKAPAKFSN